MDLPVLTTTRYVVPLKEGGSLPAVLETAEDGLYVAKFRGAGQGARALIAELIVGLLARHAGLPVPDLALLHLDAAFGRTERDPEIQDILKGSHGLNVGLRFLDGAFNYDPVAVPDLFDPDTAAAIVWFDAFVMNIDRTPRNPNLMVQGGTGWLIDHGAALYVHHDWEHADAARFSNPFSPIRNHVLLPFAGDLRAADARLSAVLTPDVLRETVAVVPDALLMDVPEGRHPSFETPAANRDAYLRYLGTRLASPRPFLDEALRAQQALVDAPPPPTRRYRR
jgi:hypothetical protein